MASIKLLDPPNYSGDERQALIDFVLALKKSHIQDFLKQVELPKSGTKQDLRDTNSAWYEADVTVPAEWHGRRVVLGGGRWLRAAFPRRRVRMANGSSGLQAPIA